MRRPQNHPRPLEGWYSPDGLAELLKQNVDEANATLASEPLDYLPIRGYQREAIRAVEEAVEKGQDHILVAMATGTGKTRTCICLLYRLIKAGRFRRILFLVDRTSLGDQAHNSFKDLKVEKLSNFTDIYDVKGLGDLTPDSHTRVHIATIQAMVRRVLFSTPSDPAPPVDQYDCIIVDECHRGYSLDRSLSEVELTFRSEDDYISKFTHLDEGRFATGTNQKGCTSTANDTNGEGSECVSSWVKGPQRDSSSSGFLCLANRPAAAAIPGSPRLLPLVVVGRPRPPALRRVAWTISPR